jgi:hypothetical protein
LCSSPAAHQAAETTGPDIIATGPARPFRHWPGFVYVVYLLLM